MHNVGRMCPETWDQQQQDEQDYLKIRCQVSAGVYRRLQADWGDSCIQLAICGLHGKQTVAQQTN